MRRNGYGYADVGLGWGYENGQEFDFVHVQVEMPIRHPYENVREVLWKNRGRSGLKI